MGFQIGDIFIPYYGLCMTIGVILAGAVGLWLVHVFHRDVDDFIILAACVGLGGLAGAKMLYFIVSWGEIDVSRLDRYEVSGIRNGKRVCVLRQGCSAVW